MNENTAEETKPKIFYHPGPLVVAAAFNRWLDDYEKNPEKFENEWATIRQNLKEKADGVEPTYGANCVGVLSRYIDELAEEERAS